MMINFIKIKKSGRRGSNPRPPPWQGDVLPLNYFRVFECRLKDLNPRPSDYKSDALPTELITHGWRLTGSNRRHPACKADALPAELNLQNINARQRPSLTKGNPSLQSALRSLTSVFEMGTGVTFLPSSPHIFN